MKKLCLVEHIWVEKNAYRSAQGLLSVGTLNDASCGVTTGDGDTCPGTNKNTEDPDPSWDGTYPTSLYHTSEPEWWCAEACDWSQDGIGAFGDDFTDVTCKIPAHIRSLGDPCTCGDARDCDAP